MAVAATQLLLLADKIKKVTYDWHFAYSAPPTPVELVDLLELLELAKLAKMKMTTQTCSDLWFFSEIFLPSCTAPPSPRRWFTEKVTSVWFTIEGEAPEFLGRNAADGFVKFVGQELLLARNTHRHFCWISAPAMITQNRSSGEIWSCGVKS